MKAIFWKLYVVLCITFMCSLEAAAPTITSLAPDIGPSAGGNAVIITGTNFDVPNLVTDVDFGGTSVPFTVDSDTQITITAPPGTDDTVVTVTVTNPDGFDTSPYTYSDGPTVSGITPTFGPSTGGTTVTITGTNFNGATGVDFGATPATGVVVVTDTTITAISPAGTGTVDVTVTTPAGTSPTTAVDQFTYIGAPTVSSVVPNIGPAAGGTTVTITGTNFVGVTDVDFGATPAASFTVDSPTQITAVSPSGTDDTTVDVTVTNITGVSATNVNDQFTFSDAPAVTSVSPTGGPLAGGTTVTITGTNLNGATAVSFGGTPATSFTVNSDTSITAISPAHVAGTVDITVTTPAGTSPIVAGDQFTYVNAPTVTSVVPNIGPPAGGTTVAITGTNFVQVSAVNFGATPAVSYIVNSLTSITAVSPAGVDDTSVNVTVTNVSGTSAMAPANLFTYSTAPSITSVSPNGGPLAGGTTVLITGSDFTGATSVKFGTADALSFTVNSDTSITAVSPAHAAGTVDISVTTPAGTSAAVAGDQFTYVNAPTVTSVVPNIGPAAGGTTVTITGTNFVNVSAVNFGANPATSFTVDSPTQITAVSPAGVDDTTVNVTVTNVSGTSATGVANQFTYSDAPAVTGLSPTAGPLVGGTTVTITGTNFNGATAVTFGGTPATSFTVNSDTSITAVSPAHVAGTVNVAVTTAAGTSASVAGSQFTYTSAPVVSGLNPNIGPAAGGTSVVITGSNFIGITGVSFGANPATSFVVNSPTQITAVAPAGVDDTTVNVTVSGAGGTSATGIASQYTYSNIAVVNLLQPSRGTTSGGTVVTLTGSNFTGATAVSFGGTPATTFTVNSDAQITAVAPAHAAGNVNVTVTTPAGTSSASAGNLYTYSDVPTITSIVPTGGPLSGGNTVTINGTSFTNTTAVTFAGVPATSFTINSDNVITAVAPSSGAEGSVNLVVTTPAGSASTPYLYTDAPVVSGLSPNGGTPSGGTVVTITGSNFANATAVTFGTTPATSFSINSDNSITAIAPASATIGPVNVRVSNISGTSVISAASQYVYTNVPVISNLSPGGSPLAGNVPVTITGSNFNGVTDVTFGGVPAVAFTVNSPTSITAIAPAADSAGAVNVAVTNVVGTSAATEASQFIYTNVIRPPRDFKGKLIINKSRGSTYFFRLTWESSLSPGAVAYNLYHNGRLIAVIPADARLIYKDRVSKRIYRNVYTLTAVDPLGKESKPVTVILP